MQPAKLASSSLYTIILVVAEVVWLAAKAVHRATTPVVNDATAVEAGGGIAAVPAQDFPTINAGLVE